MKVVYLLNGTALYGGVKVIFQHARALRRLGVEAEVVSPEPAASWFPGIEAFYRQVEDLSPERVGPADVAVGTIWFTVPRALEIPGARPFHLCQCYEALYDGIRDQWEEVETVYRLPTSKLAISPHLVDVIRQRTGQEACWIPQPFEGHLFTPPERERPTDGRLRVLLSGQWELPIKGVAAGMRALRPLFEEGWLELVRLSQDAPDEEVAFWPEAERHVQVPPESVPEILRSVDVYLGLSTEVEGFGLPTLEAMGCGRATVLTDIGATRSLDPRGEASVKIPVGDGAALVAALRRLREDVALRRRLGEAGRRLAAEFSEERTALALKAAFERAP